MVRPLIRGLVELLTQPCCLVCHQVLVPARPQQAVCASCWTSIGLPTEALQGKHPLPWIAAGSYEGRMRSILLRLRKTRNLAMVRALSLQLRKHLPEDAILASAAVDPDLEKAAKPKKATKKKTTSTKAKVAPSKTARTRKAAPKKAKTKKTKA